MGYSFNHPDHTPLPPDEAAKKLRKLVEDVEADAQRLRDIEEPPFGPLEPQKETEKPRFEMPEDKPLNEMDAFNRWQREQENREQN